MDYEEQGKARRKGEERYYFLPFIYGMAHGFSIWRAALLRSPRMADGGVGRLCEMSRDTALVAGVYLKRPVALPFPGRHLPTGSTLPGNAISSPYLSSQDEKTNVDMSLRRAGRGAQSPGCHSSFPGSPVTMTTPVMQVAVEHNLTCTRL